MDPILTFLLYWLVLSLGFFLLVAAVWAIGVVIIYIRALWEIRHATTTRKLPT